MLDTVHATDPFFLAPLTGLLQTIGDEDLSQRLIIQLLEEDLAVFASGRAAENLQLELALSESDLKGKGRAHAASGSMRPPSPPSAEELAVGFLAAEVKFVRDTALAETLQRQQDAQTVAGQHYALKAAAEERKMALDAEFAKRLQAGHDSGNVDIDAAKMKDAEMFMGREAVDDLLASDPNSKGKGVSELSPPPVSAVETTESDQEPTTRDPSTAGGAEYGIGLQTNSWISQTKMEQSLVLSLLTTSFPTCGICMEPFCVTHNPHKAARSANSSGHLAFGLRLSCPESHAYCLNCLISHIENSLSEGKTGTIVFPIRCPECPVGIWGITDEDAEKILGAEDMALWHHQKLLDTIPRFYCPNPRCSALVQVDDDRDGPQAVCPSCTSLICVPCKTIWHEGITCEQFQALPMDERLPEDRLVLQLTKAKNWRRCPSCQVIVELTVGCNHIICQCGAHFCYKCGAYWDKKQQKCARQPTCEFWDEDMLLAERERDRARAAGQVADVVRPMENLGLLELPGLVDHGAAAVQHGTAFHWIDNPAIVVARHPFTIHMIQSLVCGYCQVRLNSLADLRYHLLHVRTHPVYSCCGRFFKRDVDFERHRLPYPNRSGQHAHTVRRN